MEDETNISNVCRYLLYVWNEFHSESEYGFEIFISAETD